MSGTFADLFTQVERGRPVVVGLAKPMALTGGRSLAHYEVVIGLEPVAAADSCRSIPRSGCARIPSRASRANGLRPGR